MSVLMPALSVTVRLDRERGQPAARRHPVPLARLTAWHVRPDGRLGAVVRAWQMEWADTDEAVYLVAGENARAVESALGHLADG